MTKGNTGNKGKKRGKTSQKLAISQPLPVPKELLVAGVTLDDEIEVQRQQRMEKLKATLLEQIASGKAEAVVDSVISTMLAMERSSDVLAWRVLRAMRYRFGRSTERPSRDELKQLFLAFGGDQQQAEVKRTIDLEFSTIRDLSRSQ